MIVFSGAEMRWYRAYPDQRHFQSGVKQGETCSQWFATKTNANRDLLLDGMKKTNSAMNVFF